MRVTAATHPCLHEALEDVAHDSGRQAGWRAYEVPEPYDAWVDQVEAAMAGLTQTERNTFAIGAEHEQEVLITSPELQMAHDLLDAFFEEEGGDWCLGVRE